MKKVILPSELAEDDLSDCFVEPNPVKRKKQSVKKKENRIVTSDDEQEPQKDTKDWDIRGINEDTCKLLKVKKITNKILDMIYSL